MSIKVADLQKRIKELEAELYMVTGNYRLEASRFRPLFTVWGREYGWRKAITH